jgi:hypothetical protein
MDVQHPHFLKLAPTLGIAIGKESEGGGVLLLHFIFLNSHLSPHLATHV